jgi:hypothetical protein
MDDEHTGDRWALCAADRALFGNKSGATHLGFAVLLKLFQAEGRFPRRHRQSFRHLMGPHQPARGIRLLR